MRALGILTCVINQTFDHICLIHPPFFFISMSSRILKLSKATHISQVYFEGCYVTTTVVCNVLKSSLLKGQQVDDPWLQRMPEKYFPICYWYSTPSINFCDVRKPVNVFSNRSPLSKTKALSDPLQQSRAIVYLGKNSKLSDMIIMNSSWKIKIT